MSDVIITVRGEHEVRVMPEHATVHLSVGFDGSDRAAVVERTLAAGAPVREDIEARGAAGDVVDWTSRRLNVSADRPWNSEGKRLAPVYRAGIDFTVTFSDISAMSEWVTELSVVDGVSIGQVDWQLTPQTASEVEREVATQAVGTALARARSYAEALGLSQITPLEIADRGLISAAESAHPKVAMMRGAALAMDSTPGMEFQGQEITVSATVEGRFAAN